MGHIILQTTAGALAGILARAESRADREYLGDLIARAAGHITRGDVESFAAGNERPPEWAMVRDMATGLGMAPAELAWRALATADGEAEMVDDDGDEETPPVRGYRYVMSTADSDRARDIIAQDWELREFMTNPVGPWSHRYDLPAVGVWRNVGVHGGQLRGTFIPRPLESYDLSRTVAAQMADGTLRTVSVGLYPRAVMSRRDLAEDDPAYDARGGLYIMGPTLLECSPTPMPMNQNALRVRSVPPEQPEKPAPIARSLPWAGAATEPAPLLWG